MKTGVLIQLKKDTDIAEKFRKVKEMDLESCQVCIWDTSLFTDKNAENIRQASVNTGVEVSTLWAGWRGRATWNFYEGQYDLGLVPDEYRKDRLEDLFLAADFTAKLGVRQMATHVGFLPENPSDEKYIKTIFALKQLCTAMKKKGLLFLFESGQETPVTLLRAIEDIGTGNAFVNLDTGNLILYGKANPVDALDVIGKYVRDLHIKDGLYPTNGRSLGCEVKAGEGKVNFPVFLPKLKSLGYDGSITIEREISGEKQIEDIIHARDLIRKLWK